MNRRAKLQLHLQEAVEGLSVVVLTYHGSSVGAVHRQGDKTNYIIWNNGFWQCRFR